MKKLFTFHYSFFLLMVVLLTVSCKDKSEDGRLPAGYGMVTFELIRNNVYLVTNLEEAKTIKVTIANADGKEIKLPSMDLSGNENFISTQPYKLPAGMYEVRGYKCFDKNADLIEDLDITLTEDNVFEVEAGETLPIFLPVRVKTVINASTLYSSLQGLCLEVIGEDKSMWPKSWNFESEGIDGTWAGLEFEWDVATNTPTELIGIVIDGEPEYIINSDTGEEILVSLPEFKGMKKLPSCIENFQSLDGITIRNCEMEELCAELEHSPITSLTVYNTKLKGIPSQMKNMRKLCDVWFEKNPMTQFPEALTNCKDMTSFVLMDSPITSVPESISEWGSNLVALQITGTQITEMPDVFDKLFKVSTLVLDNNVNLSTLPASVGLEYVPYDGGGSTPTGITGVCLNGCAFTEIPAAVKRGRMQVLEMCNNKITSLSKEDFDAMPDLQTLKLDGNQLTSFPRLTNPKLGYLSLNNCGLTAEQIDITGLPKLRVLLIDGKNVLNR